jgi:hypothetical protein
MKNSVTQNLELTTRNTYQKVDATIKLEVEGRELPALGVLGEAVELAVQIIQEKITQSFKVVPERV